MTTAAEVLSTRTVYTGRIFDVTVDRVRLPHGREADLEIVRHEGSVVLIPIASDGRVLLVRQYRHAVGRFLWELPAGSVDEGETPEQAAHRECHEETGKVPATIVRMAAMFPTPGYCDEEMVFFRLSSLEEPTEAAALDEDEDIEARTFELHEAREMIRRGEIVDMKTVAGLAMI